MQATIYNIPDHVLVDIFKLLDKSSLKKVSKVCKK